MTGEAWRNLPTNELLWLLTSIKEHLSHDYVEICLEITERDNKLRARITELEAQLRTALEASDQ
jgi:hypothetical protein